MRLHLIPNSHIDPVWLWDQYEGIDEVLNTFRTACTLLDEFPRLTFTASSLLFYEWTLRHDPALFERIREHAAAGRWEVVGGWWVEADSNLPSADSLRRHADCSQAFAEKHFGRRIRVAYLPDTFGHPATLPSILADGGFDYFLFCRPGAHEKADLPANLFFWEHGNARVLAYRLKHHYLQYGAPAPERVDPARLLPRLNDPEYAASPANAYLFGVGDHGGGPARAEIAFYNGFLESQPAGSAGYSTCERFFDEAAAIPNLPAYAGDLHMHAVGCYSVMRRLKQAVRGAEQGLAFAGRAAALSPAPAPDLSAAWKTTLFNQFHDILPGSAAPHAVDQALAQLGGVEHAWHDAAYGSLKAVSRRTPTTRKTGEHRIFNTLPFAVTVPLRLESFMDFRPGAAFRDRDGRILDVQEVPPSVRCANRRWEFVDTLPARGFRAYAFDPSAAVPVFENTHYAPGDRIGLDRAAVGADGRIRVRDEAGAWRDLLAAPAAFRVLADASDTWGHGVRTYDCVEGEFQRVSTAVLAGPVTQKLLHTFVYGRSRLEAVYAVYRGLPGVYLDIRVHWAEERKILKLELAPEGAGSASFTMEAPGGWVERKADGAELPLHNGVLVPAAAPFGVVQDGAFGCDCARGRLRLTLVRSNLFGWDIGQPLQPHDPQRHTDQGEHVFRLCLLSRPGLDAAAMAQEVRVFLEPFLSIREG